MATKDKIRAIEDRLNAAHAAQSKTANQARSNRQLLHNIAYTADELSKIISDGMPPTATPILFAKNEERTGLLAAQRPKMSAVGVEDSDVDTGKVASDLLLSVWEGSSFDSKIPQTLKEDFYGGRAVTLAYIDPEADLGNGEVYLKRLEPFEVFPSPTTVEADWSDADWIDIAKLMTKGQGEKQFGKEVMDRLFRKKEKPQSTSASTRRASGRAWAFEGQQLHGDQDGTMPKDPQYEMIEEYAKRKVRRFVVREERNPVRGFTLVLDKEEYAEYRTELVYQIDVPQGASNYALSDEDVAQWYGQYQAATPLEGTLTRTIPIPRPDKSGIDVYYITPRSKGGLVDEGVIELREVWITRVEVVTLFGGVILQEVTLETEHYPIVPLMTSHDGTPYPTARATLIRNLIDQYNKYQQMQIQWISSVSGPKTWQVEGTILNPLALHSMGADIVNVEDGVGQEGGKPAPWRLPMDPLPPHIPIAMDTLMRVIDTVTGLFPQITAGAPGPSREPFRSKQQSGEAANRRMTVSDTMLGCYYNALARVTFSLIRTTYTREKVIRLEQPSNPAEATNPTTVNQFRYDDFGRAIDIIFDVTTMRYDIRYVRGSTYPTNRQQEREEALQLRQVIGPAMNTHILKKFDIPNWERIAEETDALTQATQRIEQLQEELKQKEALIKSGERRTIEDRIRIEAGKGQRQIDKQVSNVERDAAISSARIGDAQKAGEEQAAQGGGILNTINQLFDTNQPIPEA